MFSVLYVGFIDFPQMKQLDILIKNNCKLNYKPNYCPTNMLKIIVLLIITI